MKILYSAFSPLCLITSDLSDTNIFLISIPSLLPTIQELLLDCISVALSKTSYASAKPGVAGIRTNTINNTQQLSDASGSVVQLALRTLAHFDFKVGF